MRCPKCGHQKTGVYDSRSCSNGEVMLRRRKCVKCKCKFFTTETKSTVQEGQKAFLEMVEFHLDMLSQQLLKDIKAFIKEG